MGIGGDNGEGSVDFVGDAGGEQADGAEFVGLDEAAFEFVAVGDVVEDHEAADLLSFFGDEGGDGEINGGFTRRGGGGAGAAEDEFVNVMNSLVWTELVKFFDEIGGEEIF